MRKLLLVFSGIIFYSVTAHSQFTKLNSAATGVDFRNEVPENSSLNIILLPYHYNGGGVAVGDINNDGLDDIYFVANYEKDKLFLKKGNFQFEDITETAGIDLVRGWDTGVTMADVNQDGFLDIYVSRSAADGNQRAAKNQLYINNGNLTFTENALNFGLDDMGHSTQAAFFDYDLDGDLDAFVLNHNIAQMESYDVMLNKFRHPFVGDKLYQNNNGIFRNVSDKAGIKGPEINYGLGVSISDLNADGYPDIYVTNDFLEHDYMYINNGDGTFTDKLKESTYHISNFGMGVDVADMNNDALPDIMVVDMVARDNFRQKTNMSGMDEEAFWKAVADGQHYQYMINTLQLNNGNGTFSEISQLAGVSNTDWSWAPLFADLDNDGFKDLIVSNGLRKDIRNNDFVKWLVKYLDDLEKSGSSANVEQEIRVALNKIPSEPIPNYMYRNNGDLTFDDVSEQWKFNDAGFSTGLAYSDLDNDGDLDLVVNNVDGEAFVYRNDLDGNSYLQFAFEGKLGNLDGYGVTVKLEYDGQKQMQENYPSRGFQSSVSQVLHFGTGNMKEVKEATIVWPDGNQQVLKNVKPNQRLLIKYADSRPVVTGTEKTKASPFREEVIEGLQLAHKENDYNDFDDQVLLPHRLSTIGPALAIGDLTGDGLEDVFVGGSSGFASTVFVQDDKGFHLLPSVFPEGDIQFEDTDALIFDADGDGLNDIYIVSGGNFSYEGSDDYQDRLFLNRGTSGFVKATLPPVNSSGSTVRSADFDGDGDMDLFIGGRVLSGKYPYPPQSYLLQNDGKGNFKDITSTVAGLGNIGMVTDAIWTDIDNDDDPDLLIVGEWMVPVCFLNNDGTLMRTEIEGLGVLSGWWYSIAEHDINQDGHNDYLLGNLGLNYKYKASSDSPFEVYASDFDSNSKNDIVLGYYDEGTLYPVRGRQCSSEQIPEVADRFKDYESFGKASLIDIYGDMGLDNALHLEARTFESGALISDGKGGFRFTPFPNYAQLSSINGFTVATSGQILAAGNLYESEVETPRNDASTGVVLEWNGTNFDAFTGYKSGFFADGNIKKIKPLKFKGREYYIVTRNQGALSVFGSN